MSELTIEIEIEAPPERVWAALTDFAAYAEWNPYQTISGKAEPLAKVRVWSRSLDGRPFPAVRAAICKFEPNTSLEFLSGMPLWFGSFRFFHLSPSENGTLLRHGVRFTGVWIAWRCKRGPKIERMKPFHEAFGQALERRVIGRKPWQSISKNRHARRTSKA